MTSATAESVCSPIFSVPFSHWRGVALEGENQYAASQTVGLQRFVGDRPNEILKILAADEDGCRLQRLSVCGSQWPLVLFGPPGSGKTALALTFLTDLSNASTISINQSQATQPLVVSGVDFDRRYRSAMETDSVAEFRTQLIRYSGILIDNLHELATKRSTQQEISRLIDAMVAKNRPVLFTCLQSPTEVQNLLPALVSRLTGGLMLPVALPGVAARAEIIRDLADINRLRFTDDAIAWLIDRLPTSVPGINHFLVQLKALLKSKSRSTEAESPAIDAVSLIEWFQPVAKDQQKFTEQVISAVAAEFKLKPTDLSGSSRKLTIARARSIAVYLCRTMGKLSFGKIGKQFGNRDHSTIMHSVKKIKLIVGDDSESTGDSIIVVRAVTKLKQILAQQLDDTISQV